ncbi:hypothetical protein E2C01_037604 [Portunus trituberculatus]|uniref:Uncharacterized protein n=1 Tax=Portunus trituberculatus TaxID=210409 RepID=A0A5B7FF16_PORTR|nr:hypothetical protein [Portunus trituberculatus]
MQHLTPPPHSYSCLYAHPLRKPGKMKVSTQRQTQTSWNPHYILHKNNTEARDSHALHQTTTTTWHRKE